MASEGRGPFARPSRNRNIAVPKAFYDLAAPHRTLSRSGLTHAMAINDLAMHDWLARLACNGPRLVSVVLAALIALELAHAAFALRSGDDVSRVRAASVASSPQRGTRDVQDVVAAHLFGVYVAEPGAQDPANAHETAANIVLNGTIATEDPKHGVAIIKSDGPDKVYSVGDQLGGASLYLVYLDRVVLNRGGTLETLRLPRSPLGTGRGGFSRVAAAPRSEGLYVDGLGRNVDKPPGPLDKMVHFVDSVDTKTGKQRGFLVYPVASGAPLRAMGLYPGDLVTQINGIPLDDLKRGRDAIDSIQSGASITIQRQGRTMDLVMNVADAARAAEDEKGAAPVASATALE
jgi:general secretion pathway protein C